MGRLIRPTTSAPVAIVLCALVVVAEGYDLIVYGAVIPLLRAEPGWHLSPSGAGLIGSQAYIGMLIGALVGGRWSDVSGRRRTVIGFVAWFTLWTVACALAPAPWLLGAARLLTGVGIGAVLPVVLALGREITPPRRTALVFTVLLAGVPMGGLLAAALGLVVLPALGWRAMFGAGAVISLVVLALAVARLPESTDYADRSHRPRPAPLRELFGPRLRLTSVVFPLANFMILLTWFGMNTWLITIMRAFGLAAESALLFSVTLNLGAFVGGFGLAALGQRWGSRPTAAIAAVVAAAGALGLTARPAGTAVLVLLVAVIGLGAQSALNMVSAAVADAYPVALRATALGWVQGLGRLGAIVAPALGGAILGAGLGPAAVLVAFAVAALAAAVILILLVVLGRDAPPRLRDDAPRPVSAGGPTSAPQGTGRPTGVSATRRSSRWSTL